MAFVFCAALCVCVLDCSFSFSLLCFLFHLPLPLFCLFGSTNPRPASLLHHLTLPPPLLRRRVRGLLFLYVTTSVSALRVSVCVCVSTFSSLFVLRTALFSRLPFIFSSPSSLACSSPHRLSPRWDAASAAPSPFLPPPTHSHTQSRAPALSYIVHPAHRLFLLYLPPLPALQRCSLCVLPSSFSLSHTPLTCVRSPKPVCWCACVCVLVRESVYCLLPPRPFSPPPFYHAFAAALVVRRVCVLC